MLKGQIEAMLFLTGRALQVREIADKLGVDTEQVEEALLDLINDYSCRDDSALEIDDTDGYILQVRESYSNVVNLMVPIELSTGALRTLTAIALHAPLLQSELIEVRGPSAYDHIKELLENQLITKRRKERSYILNLTPKFYEYFKLTGDKEELKSLLASMKEPVDDEVVEAN